MVLADREFIGSDWIQFLHDNNITDPDRIKGLFVLVALARLVCVLVGSFKTSYKKNTNQRSWPP